MGVGIVGATVTLLWVVLETLAFPRDASEDQRTVRVAGWLLAGALLALTGVVFFVGQSLRQPNLIFATKGDKQSAARRRWALPVYLAGSLGIGCLAALLPRIPVLQEESYKFLRPVGLLVCQPHMLVQLIGGGFLGIKLGSGGMGDVATVAANLVYFPVLFYPLYRLLTMDRAAEAAACRRMKILLALLGGAYVLITLVLLFLSKA